MDCLSQDKHGTVVLRIRVQPGAARNGLAGMYDGALKVRIAAPPVDGKANKAVVKFFSSFLGVAKGNIVISSGQQSRSKSLKITGIDAADIMKLLEEASL